MIPTFQEAANLRHVVERIGETLRQAGEPYEIVVVDDDSRDGTTEVIETLSGEGHPVRLVVRTGKRGLATAVLLGFDESRGDPLVCLDADGSHPAEVLPAMIRAAREPEVDLVLGSRYTPGGSIEESWSVARRVTSRLATAMARPFTSVSDPMAGFFALRREVLRRAARLDPIGYKIALELIVKCRCVTVREVPIRFASRRAGRSKLSLGERWNYCRHLLRLARFRLGSR